MRKLILIMIVTLLLATPVFAKNDPKYINNRDLFGGVKVFSQNVGVLLTGVKNYTDNVSLPNGTYMIKIIVQRYGNPKGYDVNKKGVKISSFDGITIYVNGKFAFFHVFPNFSEEVPPGVYEYYFLWNGSINELIIHSTMTKFVNNNIVPDDSSGFKILKIEIFNVNRLKLVYDSGFDFTNNVQYTGKIMTFPGNGEKVIARLEGNFKGYVKFTINQPKGYYLLKYNWYSVDSNDANILYSWTRPPWYDSVLLFVNGFKDSNGHIDKTKIKYWLLFRYPKTYVEYYIPYIFYRHYNEFNTFRTGTTLLYKINLVINSSSPLKYIMLVGTMNQNVDDESWAVGRFRVYRINISDFVSVVL